MKDIKKIKKDLGMSLIGAVPFLGTINYTVEYSLRGMYSAKSFVVTAISNPLTLSTAGLDGMGASEIIIGHYNSAAALFATSAVLKTAVYAINTHIIRERLKKEYKGFFPLGTIIKSWINKESSENALESMLDGA